ncbi:MAG: glycosyltransferase [Bacilli bacterium]
MANAQAEQHTVYQAQIVTYNSSSCIVACVASLLQQELPPARIVILDNASQDNTADVLRQQVAQLVAAHPASIDLSILINKTNVGYAAGHNRCLLDALGTSGMPTPPLASQMAFASLASSTLPYTYVLTVNPDVVLAPDYAQKVITRAQEVGSQGIRIGGVSGKLLRSELSPKLSPDPTPESAPKLAPELSPAPESPRYPADATPPVPTMIDSAGLRMGPFLHARDRGAGSEDEGQFETPQPVWGVCGAAALYSAAMLRELAEHGPIFDDTFFIYKEDVDLCWRARLLGWSFHYEPSAIADHDRGWKRHHTPSTAAAAHSFANQIAIVTKYLAPRRPFFWACLSVESARFVLLTVRDPDAARLALRHIRENRQWNRNQRLTWQDARIATHTGTVSTTGAMSTTGTTSTPETPPDPHDDRHPTSGGTPWQP